MEKQREELGLNRETLENDRAALTVLLAHLQRAIEDWPQFDADGDVEADTDVNGGDLVEWFGEWRAELARLLS